MGASGHAGQTQRRQQARQGLGEVRARAAPWPGEVFNSGDICDSPGLPSRHNMAVHVTTQRGRHCPRSIARAGAAEKAKARVAEIASDFESDSGDSDVDPSELEREEGAGADDDAIEILSDEEMEREERPARVGRGKNKRGRAALLDR